MCKKHSLFLLPKMKKKSIKTIKAKCDKLWSEIIRSKGYCEICGTTVNLNAHHIISRHNKVLRWDLQNGICLCVSCHKFSTHSVHNDPLGFMEWFRKNYHKDYWYLRRRKNKNAFYTISDYEEIYQNLLKVKDEIR